MNLDDIAEKYAKTTKAILMCGREKCSESVLILLYSAIDSLSWLYSDQMNLDDRSPGKDYRKWVNTFLLPNLDGYDCTPQELWLARCGLLHTYSSVAKKQKDNKIIAYTYADKEKMNKEKVVPEFEKMSGKKFVLIQIGDFVKAYIDGTSAFFKLIEKTRNYLIRL